MGKYVIIFEDCITKNGRFLHNLFIFRAGTWYFENKNNFLNKFLCFFQLSSIVEIIILFFSCDMFLVVGRKLG